MITFIFYIFVKRESKVNNNAQSQDGATIFKRRKYE